mgnify:CR=1 FL=1
MSTLLSLDARTGQAHDTPLPASTPSDIDASVCAASAAAPLWARSDGATRGALLRALAGEQIRNLEYCIVLPGQPMRFIAVNADPLHTADGSLIGAVAILHDITEHKRIEQLQREIA